MKFGSAVRRSGCDRAPGRALPPSAAGQRDAGLGVQVDGRIRDMLNRSRWGSLRS